MLSISPFTSTAEGHPTFPIVIKCRSQQEAEAVNLLNNAFQAWPSDITDPDLANAIVGSELVKGITVPIRGPFYPVYVCSAGYRVILWDYA